MSGSLHAWYGLRDLEALGSRQGVLGGELTIRELRRLAGMLHATGGSVRASLHFGQRSAGWVAVRLEYETVVELTCQRCLEPLSERIADTVDLALIASDALESYVPEGCEPVVLENERLNPAQLIEDELIVSLPLVPKHARVEDCGSVARLLNEAPDAQGGESAAPKDSLGD